MTLSSRVFSLAFTSNMMMIVSFDFTKKHEIERNKWIEVSDYNSGWKKNIPQIGEGKEKFRTVPKSGILPIQNLLSAPNY